MDVQCGVCSTEYELDDALLSDRGTTVRCTNCGHQFRVYAPTGLGFAGERWVVFTRHGQRTEYASLKDLQYALGEGKLSRTDEVCRGDGPRRPLGSIAELDSFFRDPVSSSRQSGREPGVSPSHRLPNGEQASSRPSGTRGSHLEPAAAGTGRSAFAATMPSTNPAPAEAMAEPGPGGFPGIIGGGSAASLESAKPTLVSAEALARGAVVSPRTTEGGQPVAGKVPNEPWRGHVANADGPAFSQARGRTTIGLGGSSPVVGGRAAPPEQSTAATELGPRGTVRLAEGLPAHVPGSDGPAPSPDIASAVAPGLASPLPTGRPSHDPTMRSQDSRRADGPRLGAVLREGGALGHVPARLGGEAPHRASTADGSRWMWIAAAVLLPLLAIAGVLGWQYLQKSRSERHVVTVETKPTPAQQVRPSEVVTLIRQGRLDRAASKLDRAGPSQDDPEWKAADARLRVARAEVLHYLSAWYPEDAQLQARAREALTAARSAIQSAATAAGAAPALSGARVRLAWLEGEDRISALARDGGMLDQPVADRDPIAAALMLHAKTPRNEAQLAAALMEAAEPELAFGPARAGATAAWLRAGDIASATEVVDAVPVGERDESWDLAARAVRTMREEVRQPAAPPKGEQPVAERPADVEPSKPEPARDYDYRERLALASEDLRGGRLGSAERHYRSVLVEKPGNSEALTGLAQIEASRGNASSAVSLYDQLLAVNPHYMPGLQGKADLLWLGGRRSEAVAVYRRILEQGGPESSYGQRAAARIEEASGAAELPSREAPSGNLAPEPQWADAEAEGAEEPPPAPQEQSADPPAPPSGDAESEEETP